uniref:TRAP transporter small permease n=1 Tax=Castellaniella defragrans TaxID=75697 RepID=UPI003340681C
MDSHSLDGGQGPLHPQPARFGPFGRALLLASKLLAALGGLAFVGLVIMSLISIVGRKLFSAPVPGDMEVLMMVAAAASATFFAYCHLQGGDVKVDFFTAHAQPRTVLLLDAAGSLLVGLFGALIAWRSWVGAMSLREVGETSVILEWPVWLAQAGMVPGFALLGVAGLYMCGQTLRARSAGSRGNPS